MDRCLRAVRVMLRGVLRGAAWCCVVLRGVLRIPTCCCVVLHGYMVLRSDGMLGWWMMDVET